MANIVLLETVFSTLNGFQSLTITQFRAGSIIVVFDVTVVNFILPNVLLQKSQNLSTNLNATYHLTTQGVVQINMPTNPVCTTHTHNITCTTQEEMNCQSVWQLEKMQKKYDITNGTESLLIFKPQKATLTIKSISELGRYVYHCKLLVLFFFFVLFFLGTYICSYNDKAYNGTIAHIASGTLDVAQLPNIEIMSAPGFPYCSKDSSFVWVKILCEIKKSSEKYEVTWKGKDHEQAIIPINYPSTSEATDVYAAKTLVACNSAGEPTLTCIFSNRCQQTKTANIVINILNEGEDYCKAEGEWEDTKANFSAVMKCKDGIGYQRRRCRKGGNWDEVESECVNQNLASILENALIVDVGLGTVENNAADVFSRFEDATNNTDKINTFANMNASVSVLVSMGARLKQINNDSTVDNLLQSSSNLLDKSISNAWSTNINTKENVSMAERYLTSVEQLIKMTNVTTDNKAKPNIEVAVCDTMQKLKCTHAVFNVTVCVQGSNPGILKTTGFTQLEMYLPHKDEKYDPNTIVVSATIDKEQLDSPSVIIDFTLLRPRPRNHKLKCVYWDTANGEWSTQGCEWESHYKGVRCKCTHLSSFAVLMSKYPEEILGLQELSYVGLSISVFSLILSLTIELVVWSTVVKTDTLFLRHTAHINISLCLLIADGCFLASLHHGMSETWCQVTVVLKHFCYLAMFFWMLCLSSTLLHQAVFLFHNISKKVYTRFSLILGYFCPFLIVIITFITNDTGSEGSYFSRDTCWLIYTGLMKGSIHTFFIPAGIIVFVNIFCMVVVIMKLLDRPKTPESMCKKEKTAVKSIMRSLILLSPVFGVTWVFGFAVTAIDFASGPEAHVVNYVFTLLNSFQGLFILITTCFGDKMVRDALMKRFSKKAPQSISKSSTKSEATQ
ncbi:adhesion G-protein coupled receptor F3 [Thalassophryne amazonica]|uniref:adhesion G-protein coupled receptor F3 n=1 Tax=Thalassophryne amazonica TaxID=390379 RepID=UPI0014725280|nr:adhesion G-protein coupled receptor F3 [Thalassophryne amazonica]